MRINLSFLSILIERKLSCYFEETNIRSCMTSEEYVAAGHERLSVGNPITQLCFSVPVGWIYINKEVSLLPKIISVIMNKFLSFVIFFIFSVHFANFQSKINLYILFIFADDQCYMKPSEELGLTDIDTPNLDRLTKAGTTFTRAYNMGSWSGASLRYLPVGIC